MPVLTYVQLLEQRDELAQMLREAGEKLDRCLPAGGRHFLNRLDEILPQEVVEA